MKVKITKDHGMVQAWAKGEVGTGYSEAEAMADLQEALEDLEFADGCGNSYLEDLSLDYDEVRDCWVSY